MTTTPINYKRQIAGAILLPIIAFLLILWIIGNVAGSTADMIKEGLDELCGKG